MKVDVEVAKAFWRDHASLKDFMLRDKYTIRERRLIFDAPNWPTTVASIVYALDKNLCRKGKGKGPTTVKTWTEWKCDDSYRWKLGHRRRVIVAWTSTQIFLILEDRNFVWDAWTDQDEEQYEWV